MHPYSLINNEKSRIRTTWILCILTLCVFNFLESKGLINFIQELEKSIDLLSFLSKYGVVTLIITPLLIFQLLYTLFEKMLWKIPLVMKWTGVPDISGKYMGILYSSYQGGKQLPIELTIEQNFSKIEFISTFTETNSKSNSKMGALMKCDEHRVEFIFAYANESKDFNIESQAHEGMNTLYFDLNKGSIEGKYFTNRGIIPNKGTMELEKVDSVHKP